MCCGATPMRQRPAWRASPPSRRRRGAGCCCCPALRGPVHRRTSPDGIGGRGAAFEGPSRSALLTPVAKLLPACRALPSRRRVLPTCGCWASMEPRSRWGRAVVGGLLAANAPSPLGGGLAQPAPCSPPPAVHVCVAFLHAIRYLTCRPTNGRTRRMCWRPLPTSSATRSPRSSW